MFGDCTWRLGVSRKERIHRLASTQTEQKLFWILTLTIFQLNSTFKCLKDVYLLLEPCMSYIEVSFWWKIIFNLILNGQQLCGARERVVPLCRGIIRAGGKFPVENTIYFWSIRTNYDLTKNTNTQHGKASTRSRTNSKVETFSTSQIKYWILPWLQINFSQEMSAWRHSPQQSQSKLLKIELSFISNF